ncbi:hypothetical protein SNE25_16140 [Mucilaginibacter sabulilitoris]|uniref:Uncharacterized protein n=1 Tax=Mucilaginibacter sabulilitoris TaxID=1173583 RepID=A0ABZ0TYB7_9SPHI|nr:hypothetical protein [Mucilaginibacter sabulilitoris]WPU97053.1 hypothetical protein SNE25_16140 [Mucilaginibacter sabulilitoris]
MAAEIITKEDLEQFGQKLIQEPRALLIKPNEETKRWLKSCQVKAC